VPQPKTPSAGGDENSSFSVARPASRTLVPFEYIGVARALRNKIVAAKATGAAAKLLAPFRPRPGFTPFPTHRRMYRLCQSWVDLPDAGRLSFVANLREGRLRVAELRVVPARIRFEGWDDDELALSLRSMAAICAPPAFTCAETLIADVGLHALARRFERGNDRNEATVLRDLSPLAHAHRAVGGKFAIPATSGGSWVGAVTTVAGQPVLAVRTFVSSPSEPSA